MTISTIGTTKPGVAIAGTVQVTTPNAVPGLPANNVAGQQVVLTLPATSSAFFTDGTPDPAPVNGANTGELKSLGKTITVTTGAGGVTPQFFVAIERDAGFDDDGLVEAIVTATAGVTATSPADTEDVDFDSANPLNGGEVQLVLSPAGEQDASTDPADTGQNVYYDVYTTDQFGNRVGGATVGLTAVGDDDDTDTDIEVDGVGVNSVLSDFDDDGDFYVTTDDADDVTVTATWNAPFSEYAVSTANPPVVTTTTGNRALTDTADVTFANTTFEPAGATLTGNPETSAPVNTAVAETFTAVDSNGDPIVGAPVTFTRSGAGGVRDRHPHDQRRTVSRPTCSPAPGWRHDHHRRGHRAGLDPVGERHGAPSPPSARSQKAIRVNTTGGQANGGRTDIIRIRVTGENSAAGAQATLFKKVNGRTVRVPSVGSAATAGPSSGCATPTATS